MRARSIIWPYLLWAMLIIVSCNDQEAFDCFKSPGEIVEWEFEPERFNGIVIEDGMDIFLELGSTPKIVIKGGENLLPKVKWRFDSTTLILANENTCNWTRDYERIQVYITTPELDYITHNGYGNITSLSTLGTRFLLMKLISSSGDVSLNLDSKQVYIISNSLSTLKLTGNTDYLSIGHYYNDGIFDGEYLNAKRVKIDHKGYNQMKIRVLDSLSGDIFLNGKVEYFTSGAHVDVKVHEHGSLIHAGS